jgi:hypothetical protein
MRKRLLLLPVLALAAALIAGGVTGCGGMKWPDGSPVIPGDVSAPKSPQGRVDAARQAFVAGVKTMNALIEAKVIRDKAAKQSILKAAEEIDADLDAAQDVIDANGDPFRIDFLVERALASIGRWRGDLEARENGKKVSR